MSDAVSDHVGPAPETPVCTWEGENWNVEQAKAWVEINNTFYRLRLNRGRVKGDTGISQVIRALEEYADLKAKAEGSPIRDHRE